MTTVGWVGAALFAALLCLVPTTVAAVLGLAGLAMIGMAFPPGQPAHAQIVRRSIARRAPPEGF